MYYNRKDIETKKILFLFRDFDSLTENFNSLRDKMMINVNKIWADIRKVDFFILIFN